MQKNNFLECNGIFSKHIFLENLCAPAFEVQPTGHIVSGLHALIQEYLTTCFSGFSEIFATYCMNVIVALLLKSQVLN